MSFEDDLEAARPGGYRISERSPLLSSAPAAPASSSTSAAIYEYDALYQACLGHLQTLSNTVTNIQTLTQALGGPKDSVAVRERLRSIMERTRDDARLAGDKLKSLMNLAAIDKSKRAMVNKLNTDFQTWLARYSEASKAAAAKEKSSLPPPPPIVSSSPRMPADLSMVRVTGVHRASTAEEREGEMRREEDRDRRRLELMQLQNQQQFNASLIMERDAQVKDIETAVLEVNSIFQDLAKLTAEQSHVVDNIESNIEKTANNTAAAQVQIRKAAEHQKTGRGIYCWIMLACVIIVAIAVAATWLGLKFVGR